MEQVIARAIPVEIDLGGLAFDTYGLPGLQAFADRTFALVLLEVVDQFVVISQRFVDQPAGIIFIEQH